MEGNEKSLSESRLLREYLLIFVTVGTHEQPYDRLIKEVDRLKGENVITEDVVIQTGYSTCTPQHCKYQKMFSYDEMEDYIEKAHIVITHGGPASFLPVIEKGKVPVVVPRQKQYGEHVNDHQVDFCRQVKERFGGILLVEDIGRLGDTIIGYDDTTHTIAPSSVSNRETFLRAVEKMAERLVYKQ